MFLTLCKSGGEALAVRLFIILSIPLAVWVNACTKQSFGDSPKASYDQTTGRLRRLEFDVNRNGRNDSVSFMDGARIEHVELDADENGKVERWDFYGPDRKLAKVGLASHNDGVMDSLAFYEPEGVLARLEISTHRDGVFNRVEFYEHWALTRSTEDTDGDGRPDKWETYLPNPNAAPNEPGYSISSVAFDDSGRGTPTRRFIYDDRGTVLRVEIDSEGDGHFTAERIAIDSQNTNHKQRAHK